MQTLRNEINNKFSCHTPTGVYGPRDFLRLAVRRYFADLHVRAAQQFADLQARAASLAWAANQPSDVGEARGAEKGDWWDPILHPIKFYERAAELRRWGQDVFEDNSFQRHYHVSYILTNEYGPNWTRLAGTVNEIQGFFWHDIWHLRSRLSGESPWAFQIDDLTANEQGIRDSVLREEQ